jgi:peptide/nickel transport system permease protein
MKSDGNKVRTSEWAARLADLKYTLYLLRRNPLVLIGTMMSIFFIILALSANYIVNPRLANPTGYPEYGGQYPFSRSYVWNNHIINWGSGVHIYPGPEFFYLGTDGWGRDLFQMIILAIPVDIENAIIITLAATAFGTFLGALAGYIGGKIDETILRITDIFFAFPGLVLALVFAAMFGRSIPTLRLAILLVWWPSYVRLMRGQILAEKEKAYVEALRALGTGYSTTALKVQKLSNDAMHEIAKLGKNIKILLLLKNLVNKLVGSILSEMVVLGMHMRILFRHIALNSIYPILVQATMDFGGVILTFSALMFLGFSPSPALPELGNLASDGYLHIFDAPWLIIFPGLTILLISLAFNLVGDSLRDVLDPRLRR